MLKTPVLCVLCISRSVRKCVYTTFVTLGTIVNGLCVEGGGEVVDIHFTLEVILLTAHASMLLASHICM